MTLVNKILILGAGQSAVYAASEIRKHDTDSIIKIFNEENYLPYERPPLSKDFLLNEKNEDEFLFFSKDFYEEKRIELINRKIISVDFKNKLVFTNDNLKYSYDKLLIATGSINRQLKFDEVIDTCEIASEVGVSGAKTYFRKRKDMEESEFDKLWKVMSELNYKAYQRKSSSEQIQWWKDEWSNPDIDVIEDGK